MLNPVHFLGLGFGSGLIPVMPGTFGSLAAIPVLLLMQPLPLWGFWTVTVLACVVGVYLCGKTARDMQYRIGRNCWHDDYIPICPNFVVELNCWFCTVPVV